MKNLEVNLTGIIFEKHGLSSQEVTHLLKMNEGNREYIQTILEALIFGHAIEKDGDLLNGVSPSEMIIRNERSKKSASDNGYESLMRQLKGTRADYTNAITDSQGRIVGWKPIKK